HRRAVNDCLQRLRRNRSRLRLDAPRVASLVDARTDDALPLAGLLTRHASLRLTRILLGARAEVDDRDHVVERPLPYAVKCLRSSCSTIPRQLSTAARSMAAQSAWSARLRKFKYPWAMPSCGATSRPASRKAISTSARGSWPITPACSRAMRRIASSKAAAVRTAATFLAPSPDSFNAARESWSRSVRTSDVTRRSTEAKSPRAASSLIENSISNGYAASIGTGRACSVK